MRFVLMVASLAAIELGRHEGAAFAFAVLFHGQLYQLFILQRIIAHLRGAPTPGDSRPFRLQPGWLDVDWRLREANSHILRAAATAIGCAVVLYLRPSGTVMAILVLHVGSEASGVVRGRVLDRLVQVEVRLRVALERGEPAPEGWDRGDYRA